MATNGASPAPTVSRYPCRVAGNLVTASGVILPIASLEGLGLFLAPGFVIADDLEAGRLVQLLPAWRPVEFAINAIYPHRQHLSAKVSDLFVDLVSHCIGQEARWLQPGAPGQAIRAAGSHEGPGASPP